LTDRNANGKKSVVLRKIHQKEDVTSQRGLGKKRTEKHGKKGEERIVIDGRVPLKEEILFNRKRKRHKSPKGPENLSQSKDGKR